MTEAANPRIIVVIRSLRDVAQHAVERRPEVSGTGGLCQNPGTVAQRRIVANMLGVPALELRDPVPLSVLVKTGDASIHPEVM